MARPTDDQLLDAARAVFGVHGFRQATMEGIAQRAGSTKPTLLRVSAKALRSTRRQRSLAGIRQRRWPRWAGCLVRGTRRCRWRCRKMR
jgi:Bacterial regulatory proteins, tetR family